MRAVDNDQGPPPEADAPLDADVARWVDAIVRRLGEWLRPAGVRVRRLGEPEQASLLRALWVLAIVLVAVTGYWHALWHPSDGYDETYYIRRVACVNWDNVFAYCMQPEPGVFPYFRPLGFLSLYLDRVVWGRPAPRIMADGRIDEADLDRQAADPAVSAPFRVDNLLVFIASCLALGLMVQQVSGRRSLGMLTGVLYAASPDNAIVVPYYPDRFVVLCALFSFEAIALTFRWAGDGGRWWHAALAAGAFGLALLCKEHAGIVPAIIGVWAALLLPRRRWWRVLVVLLAMGGVLGPYLLVRVHVLGYLVPPFLREAGHRPWFWTLPVRFVFGAPWMPIQSVVLMQRSGWALLTADPWARAWALVAFWSSAYVIVRRQWRLTAAFFAWMLLMYAPIAHAYAYDFFPYKLYLPSSATSLFAALIVLEWWEIAWHRRRWQQLAVLTGTAYSLWTWVR
jgi:hypothetical protein